MFKKLTEIVKNWVFSEYQQEMLKEFEERKLQIKRQNYINLMQERLMPYVRTNIIAQEDYMPSDLQVEMLAHRLFIQGKEDGKIDELNRVIIDD